MFILILFFDYVILDILNNNNINFFMIKNEFFLFMIYIIIIWGEIFQYDKIICFVFFNFDVECMCKIIFFFGVIDEQLICDKQVKRIYLLYICVREYNLI